MTKAEDNEELLAMASKALDEIENLARQPELNAEAKERLQKIQRHAATARTALGGLDTTIKSMD